MRKVLGAVGGIVAVAVFHLATFAIGGVFLFLQIGAGVLLLSWLFGWPFEL